MACITIDSPVVEKVAALVAAASESDDLELEVRMGFIRNGKFSPGISRPQMDNIIQALDRTGTAVHCLQSCGQWDEIEDFYYTHDGKRLRTRVLFDSHAMAMKSVTVEKTRIDSVLIRSHSHDLRVSLSRETPVASLPHAVTTDLVRIKQLKQFTVDGSPFRIDCSTVWHGPVRSAAEAMQTTSDGVFEVELEFLPSAVDAKKYAGPQDKVARRLARSMLFKAADLMMSPKVHMQLDTNR